MMPQITHEYLSAEKEADLVRRAQEGDKEARDYLLYNNLPLVFKVAGEYHINPESVTGIGTCAVLDAIQHFDPKYARFATLALKCIRNAVGGYLHKEHQYRNRNPESLNVPAFDDSPEPRIDSVTSKEKTPSEFSQRHAVSALPRLLENLTQREKLFIERYYGLDGYPPQPYYAIATKMDVSRETVRLTINKALKKLRSWY